MGNDQSKNNKDGKGKKDEGKDAPNQGSGNK